MEWGKCLVDWKIYKMIEIEKLKGFFYLSVRGDIHTEVATLNVNITWESEPPPPLTLSVATNIPSFWRKTKNLYFLSYHEYQETSKEHLNNDKVAINIVLNIIKHEWRTNTNSMKRQTYHHCRPTFCGWFACLKKNLMQTHITADWQWQPNLDID